MGVRNDESGGKRQGFPIWPPHSGWTVRAGGGGKPLQRSDCALVDPRTVTAADVERKKEIDGEGSEIEGRMSPVPFHLAELERYARACSSARKDSGQSGNADRDASGLWRTARQVGARVISI